MSRAPMGEGSADPGGRALWLTHPEPVALRVGDDERNSAAAALGEHLAAGRISIDEYGQRSAQAFAAQTEVDLGDLFRDLPELHPSTAGLATKSTGQHSTPRSATARAQTPVLPDNAEVQRSMAERLAAVGLGLTSMVTFVAVVALLHFWSEAWLFLLIVPALAAAAEATWGKGWRTRYL